MIEIFKMVPLSQRRITVALEINSVEGRVRPFAKVSR